MTPPALDMDGNTPVAEPDGSSGRPTVLVVQDSYSSERYGQILWYNGYDVIHTVDAHSGYRAVKANRPDIILLDLDLPQMDGLEMYARLRADGYADIPVVGLGGGVERELGARAAAIGFSEFIARPADPVRVLHVVERLVGRAPAAGVGKPPVIRRAG